MMSRIERCRPGIPEAKISKIVIAVEGRSPTASHPQTGRILRIKEVLQSMGRSFLGVRQDVNSVADRRESGS
jgi:hypothetical protein